AITWVALAFGCLGCLSKCGERHPVGACPLCSSSHPLEELQASMPLCKIDLSPLYQKPPTKQGKHTLEAAKELYPEWYQSKIVEGKPLKKTWTCTTALYEWGKAQMDGEVKDGGRYYPIMALCACGLKCGIPEEQIRQDAYGFVQV
ncbi:hypothetical protein BGU93_19350, partial [Clostridioides difficile]